MSSANPQATQLHLDPGPQPRTNPRSRCECVFVTLVLSTCLAIGLLLFALTFPTARNFFGPHQHMYYNKSIDRLTPNECAFVVRPLFDHSNQCDIVVTVWLQTQGKHRADSSGLMETPIYSGVAFQGVRLTDNNVFTKINFTLPTALFHHANLSNYDLRASFMFIPTGSSLLDVAASFSSWIPPALAALRIRPWPYPLGSLEIRDKTIQDQILESFGVSIPLIQFHGIRTRCADHQETSPPSEPMNHSYRDSDDPRKDDSGALRSLSDESTSLMLTDGLPVLKAHPYVVTRTHIRIVDETSLFDRGDFIKAHQKLKASCCGQSGTLPPNIYSCKKSYPQNGQWETYIELNMKDEGAETFHKEWAYGPFISPSKYSLGPKDLVPIPVNRENCIGPLNEPEKELLDISWQLSYSGQTPAKFALSSMADQYQSYSFSQAEDEKAEQEKAEAHGFLELANGILGTRFSPAAHPRRRFGIIVLQEVLSIVMLLLDIRYWYTSCSTVSISIVGATLFAVSDIINKTVPVIVMAIAEKHTVLGWIRLFLFHVLTSLLVPFLMIKAVTRIELHWGRGTSWMPVLRAAPATHYERASKRKEVKFHWGAKMALFLSITIIYYLKPPHTYHVIPASYPSPVTTAGLCPAILSSMATTGKILQLILNSATRHFAGGYAFAAVLQVTMNAVGLAEFVPTLVGDFENRRALPAEELLTFGLSAAAAYQALTLPTVEQGSQDEHLD